MSKPEVVVLYQPPRDPPPLDLPPSIVEIEDLGDRVRLTSRAYRKVVEGSSREWVIRKVYESWAGSAG